VQYVFSDKTGTLTENKMLFRRCAVGGQDYSHMGDNENLLPCSRLKEDLLIGTFRHRLQEFLIVLATCNTVVVNSQPHHDSMNSSGVIEEPQKNGSGPTRFVHVRLNERTTDRLISFLKKKRKIIEYDYFCNREIRFITNYFSRT